MKEIILSLLAGLIVGFIFALLKLPIPAPPVLSGIIGIFGVYLGYQVFQWIAPMFTSSP
jgi:XapX domain-containing protein